MIEYKEENYNSILHLYKPIHRNCELKHKTLWRKQGMKVTRTPESWLNESS